MDHLTAVTCRVDARDKFELTASADRSSFVLLSRADYYVAHLKGDDAARFDADYEALRRQHPQLSPDQTLARLWDEGGYSWHAAQYAD